MKRLNEIISYIKDVKFKSGYILYFDEEVQKFDGNIKKDFLELGLFDGKKSIMIKYLDGSYYIDETLLSEYEIEIIEFLSELGGKVKIGYVYEICEDEFCENFKTKTLKKVVYLGEGE